MPLTQVRRTPTRRLRSLQVRGVPGQIRTITGMTVAVLVLLFATLMVTTASAREGLSVIGHDAGPQVVATADLYLALSDMDAQVANVLLMGEDADYDAQREEALRRYDQRRAEAGRALLQSFELAGGNQEHQQTIQAVLAGLGRYERYAGQALLLGEQAEYAAGSPPRRVVEAYRAATDLMRFEVLPQAYNLTLENGTVVRRTHDQERAAMLGGRGVVALGGILALGCLVWLQVFLARRFRRMFNPALLLASAVTAMYTFSGVTVLGREATALLTAKQDGFDSVLTLARARAISNGLHADQSRYLLDPQRADTYAHVYFEKSQSMLYVEADNLRAYYAGVAAVAGGYPQDKGFLGLLRAASDNQVGAGHATMARVLTAYERFQRADGRLRALPSRGQRDEAVAMRMGALSAEFGRYDAGLVELTVRHRTIFDRAVGDGERALAGLWFLLPAAMISIAVLVVAGVTPRLHEYR